MTPEPDRGAGSFSSGRALRVTAVVILAALSLLPVSDWLQFSFRRAQAFQVMDWGTGTLLVVLLAAVVFLIVRPEERARSIRNGIDALIHAWDARPLASTLILATTASVVYGITSWLVFDAKPVFVDELVQVIQSRIFAGGRLWLPLDAHPEFRSFMHMVAQDGRWYAQFPPGGPAMLALGELFHATWIVDPICGGVSVAAFALALRWNGMRPGISLGASVAFAFAPFVVFQSASHMNHVTALTWTLVATAALVRATRSETDRPLAGLVCGIGLGMAATIRPLDAAAWAIPAAFWLGARAFKRGYWQAFVCSGIGVAIPMSAMMWANSQMTGGALTFGYTVLWGKAHGLGFHTSPWGESHTVARGLALTATYLNRLNQYMFEVPVPSLLPALGTLWLARKADALERYLYVSAAFVLGAYFAYWHDGFYLGPRFMLPLAPVAALLVAQLPGLVAARWPGTAAVRGVGAAYVAALALGVVLVLPTRARSDANAFQSMRWDYDAIARSAGASGGTILVRESWGAQVIQRLWALGVSHSLTEVLYRRVDTCGLDDMATRLEKEGVRGAAAEARLTPMFADSARVVPSTMSPDDTERMLPGSTYPPECGTRIMDDRAGYTLFGPMLLARDTSVRWIRDLHARDSLVVSLGGTQKLWLLRRGPHTDDFSPVLVPLSLDSLRTAWSGR